MTERIAISCIIFHLLREVRWPYDVNEGVVTKSIHGIGMKDPRLRDVSKEIPSERIFRKVMGRKMRQFGRKEKLFSQGDPAKNIIYTLAGC